MHGPELVAREVGGPVAGDRTAHHDDRSGRSTGSGRSTTASTTENVTVAAEIASSEHEQNETARAPARAAARGRHRAAVWPHDRRNRGSPTRTESRPRSRNSGVEPQRRSNVARGPPRSAPRALRECRRRRRLPGGMDRRHALQQPDDDARRTWLAIAHRGDALVDGRMRVEEPEDGGDGRSSARFCAPRRRIAEMNAAGRPVSASANRSARRSLWRDQALPSGVSSSETSAAGEHQQRQRGEIAGTGRAGAAARVRRARQSAAADDRPRLERQRRPDVVVHVMRDLVRQDHLDLVVRVVLQQRVGDEDAPRAAGADQRRVRPRRLLAEAPLSSAGPKSASTRPAPPSSRRRAGRRSPSSCGCA
jgi:hypothetical protein